jgi:hypothetical protein
MPKNTGEIINSKKSNLTSKNIKKLPQKTQTKIQFKKHKNSSKNP